MKNGLAIFWHVYAVNNWKEIVDEQAQILNDSGLIYFPIKISVSGLERMYAADRLRDIGETFLPNQEYEFPCLDLLYSFRSRFDVALYFHTKGVTHPNEQKWRAWRNILNNRVLRKWEDHAYAIRSDRFDVSGQNYIREDNPHFSGNFWMASSDYIKRLPNVQSLDWKDRHTAESWVCSVPHRPHALPFIEPGGDRK